MTNRDRAVSGPYEISPSEEIRSDERVQRYWMQAGCYRRDNKKWKKPQYQASEELNIDLEALFMEGENHSSEGSKKKASKYTAVEAVAVLRNMIGTDGHRKYRIGGRHGQAPDVSFVKARFSKRKNDGARSLLNRRTRCDKYESMNFSQLKAECIAAFDNKSLITEKELLSKILEIDDEIKYGGHDNQYSILSANQLQVECKNRKLPFKFDKNSLRTVLRAKDKLKAVDHTRSNQSFIDASDLAAASATQHRILNNSST